MNGKNAALKTAFFILCIILPIRSFGFLSNYDTLYICNGESGYFAEKRFEIHKNKIPTRSGFSQHNKYVTKYGLYLSKKQYQNIPEFKTSDEGKAAEKNKARQLRKKGHAVYCDKQILKELLEEDIVILDK